MILIHGGADHKFDETIARWVLDKINADRVLTPGSYYAIGVMARGEIAAAALYHDYHRVGDGGRIEMSFASASPCWAHPKIIGALLHYPFVQVGCHVVIATVKKKNRRCRKLLEGLGFGLCGCLPNWPYGEDTMIYALTRKSAERWVPSLVVEQRRAA